MVEDRERDLGQGEKLPGGTALQLVLSYCVHHCYTETLQALDSSCNLFRDGTNALLQRSADAESGEGMDSDLGPGVAFDDVAHRAPIYNYVLQGDVQTAIQLTNQCAPGMLDSCQDVYFDLLTLQFAELVKRKDLLGALRFARKELRPFGCKLNTSPNKEATLEKLQDLVTLLAYEDPFTSPVGEFLTEEYRQRVADEVNGSLLEYTHRPSQAPLERLLQHTIVTRDRLATEGGTHAPPRFSLCSDVKNHCVFD